MFDLPSLEALNTARLIESRKAKQTAPASKPGAAKPQPAPKGK